VRITSLILVVAFSTLFLQSQAVGQTQHYQFNGSGDLTLVGTPAGTTSFSGSFSIDLSAPDNDLLPVQGIFDLTDVDILLNGSQVSTATLTQTTLASGDLRQAIEFSFSDAVFSEDIVSLNFNNVPSDPNTPSFLDIDRFGPGFLTTNFLDGSNFTAFGDVDTFSIEEITAVPEPGTGVFACLVLMSTVLPRRRRRECLIEG